MTLNEALALRKDKRLVFTNGVFDILHAGHVTYLEQARELGDMLIVAINTDESVRRLGKGPDRPINVFEDRAKVLGALRCVDGVISLEEDTPISLIDILTPEVHCKGGDYDPETMPETPAVRAYGGEVVILPLVIGRSTTETVRRLRDE